MKLSLLALGILLAGCHHTAPSIKFDHVRVLNPEPWHPGCDPEIRAFCVQDDHLSAVDGQIIR